MNTQQQADRSDIDWYNHVYTAAAESPGSCQVSIGDLSKARKRVRQALRAFNLPLDWSGKRVLDVGCGLGSVAGVFCEAGAAVTAVDVSQAAITHGKARFPRVDFRCLSFPEELADEPAFDLIWLLDVPFFVKYDADGIKKKVLLPTRRYLKPDGAFILGTHSNFSGTLITGWAHWSFAEVWKARTAWNASGPIIPQLRYFWLSIMACQVCRVVKRPAPIFLRVKGADLG